VAGCWLVLPSFEHLVIPPAFHGSFSHYFTLILPAMLCFALTQYCVGPAFQIVHRTMPLIIGGIVSASANGLALLLLPTSADASSFALAQSIGGCASLATMVAFLVTLEPMWPRPRDIAGALVGTAAMVLAVAPLRAMCPCVPTVACAPCSATAIGSGRRHARPGRARRRRRGDVDTSVSLKPSPP
jgi:hypothetical protein